MSDHHHTFNELTNNNEQLHNKLCYSLTIHLASSCITSRDLACTRVGTYLPLWCFQSITTSEPSERESMVPPNGLCLSTCDGIPGVNRILLF